MHYFIDFILESIGTYQSGISSMNTVYDITSRNFISGLCLKSCFNLVGKLKVAYLPMLQFYHSWVILIWELRKQHNIAAEVVL